MNVAWYTTLAQLKTTKRVIDLCTFGAPLSLGTTPIPKKLFAYAADTHELFKTLFNGYDNPVKTFYEMLSCLAPGKRVMTRS